MDDDDIIVIEPDSAVPVKENGRENVNGEVIGVGVFNAIQPCSINVAEKVAKNAERQGTSSENVMESDEVVFVSAEEVAKEIDERAQDQKMEVSLEFVPEDEDELQVLEEVPGKNRISTSSVPVPVIKEVPMQAPQVLMALSSTIPAVQKEPVKTAGPSKEPRPIPVMALQPDPVFSISDDDDDELQVVREVAGNRKITLPNPMESLQRMVIQPPIVQQKVLQAVMPGYSGMQTFSVVMGRPMNGQGKMGTQMRAEMEAFKRRMEDNQKNGIQMKRNEVELIDLEPDEEEQVKLAEEDPDEVVIIDDPQIERVTSAMVDKNLMEVARKANEKILEPMREIIRCANAVEKEALANPFSDWSFITDQETTVIKQRTEHVFKHLLTIPAEKLVEIEASQIPYKEPTPAEDKFSFDTDIGKYVLERYLEKKDLDFEREFGLTKEQLAIVLMYGIYEESNRYDVDFTPICRALEIEKYSYYQLKAGLLEGASEEVRDDENDVVGAIRSMFLTPCDLCVVVVMAICEINGWPLTIDWDLIKYTYTLDNEDLRDYYTTIINSAISRWDAYTEEQRRKETNHDKIKVALGHLLEHKKQYAEKSVEIFKDTLKMKNNFKDDTKDIYMTGMRERSQTLEETQTPNIEDNEVIYLSDDMEEIEEEIKKTRIQTVRLQQLPALVDVSNSLDDRLQLRDGQFVLAKSDPCDVEFVEARVVEKVGEDKYKLQYLGDDHFDVTEISDIANIEVPLCEPEVLKTTFLGLRVVGYVQNPNSSKFEWLAGTVACRPNGAHDGDFLVFFDLSFEMYIPGGPRTVANSDIAMNFKENVLYNPPKEFQNALEAFSWLSPLLKGMRIFPLCKQALKPDGQVDKGLVWTLVDDPTSQRQRFIQRFFEKYPSWPLVTFKKPGPARQAQSIQCMRNNQTRTAYCVHIDRQMCVLRFQPGSLHTPAIQGTGCFTYPCPNKEHVHFDEWVYRGSGRLNSVNIVTDENTNMSNRQREKNRRIVEYSGQPMFSRAMSMPSFGTARKSNVPSSCMMENSAQRSAGELAAKEEAKKKANKFKIENCVLPTPPDKLPAHEQCTAECLMNRDCDPSEKRFHGMSPLAIPMYCGWKRSVLTFSLEKRKCRRWQKCKQRVVYRSPCGAKTFTRHEDVHDFMKATNSQLTIDLFCFDPSVNVIGRILVDPSDVVTADYTKGCELIPIPAVNSLDKEQPPQIIYGARRCPFNESVDTSTINPQFCSGCTCEGDCSDAEKCECQQLTKSNFYRLAGSFRGTHYGYDHRSLKAKTYSGIFECNENCHCNKRKCFNRVVQNDIKYPLQLFKTPGCGWGVRTICDIPRGAFIANYVGVLMTDAVADQQPAGHDAYFADLDLNDVVEREKATAFANLGHLDLGFTSDQSDDEEDSEDDMQMVPDAGDSSDSGADEGYVEKKKMKRELGDNVDDDEDKEEDDEENSNGGVRRSRSKRARAAAKKMQGALAARGPPQPPQQIFKWAEYFGETECLYVIDAKTKGNIGRFLNHSCDPNVGVQQVLVDTHDLRLPWTAFFANRTIKAGEELCWNYNYTPAPDRPEELQLFCECGSPMCQGRLL